MITEVEQRGRNMRLHSLQHIPFEDLAHIEMWAQDKSHSVSRTLLFNNDPFPQVGEFDWLIILGGPMNIYEEKEYPWLKREKKFIAEAIAQQKVVLGICLGAQLVADCLGGKVITFKEIGWYPVRLTPEAKNSRFSVPYRPNLSRFIGMGIRFPFLQEV